MNSQFEELPSTFFLAWDNINNVDHLRGIFSSNLSANAIYLRRLQLGISFKEKKKSRGILFSVSMQYISSDRKLCVQKKELRDSIWPLFPLLLKHPPYFISFSWSISAKTSTTHDWTRTFPTFLSFFFFFVSYYSRARGVINIRGK